MAATIAKPPAQARLAKLTPRAREALLLRTLEDFDVDQIALIMGRTGNEIEELIAIGALEIEADLSSRVLVIKDEAIIAMDLEAIVRDLGHDVIGIARTRKEAVAAVAANRPDLVLADIQLADGSSGTDAVIDILKEHSDLPAIFITAYPERLLTGERPETTFLITKPFKEAQVRAAIDQILFFGSTVKVEIRTGTPRPRHLGGAGRKFRRKASERASAPRTEIIAQISSTSTMSAPSLVISMLIATS